MADTAALVVALSAQITKFERDMLGAVNVAKKRTAEIEGTFTQMNKAIVGQFAAVAIGFQSRLGGLGGILATLGPGGVAAATGLGAAVAAIVALTNATADYVEKISKLKDASELIGLTVTQLKALQRAGKDVGVSGDDVTEFATKFLSQLEEMRAGGGKLFDVLLKIDQGLLTQLTNTKDSAEAINILADAYARLTDQAKRLELSRAAGGRGGLATGRFLETVSQAGGVQNLAENTKNIDEQAKLIDQLSKDLERIKAQTANIWGSMFAPEILQQQIEVEKDLQKIASVIERIGTAVRSFSFSDLNNRIKAADPKGLAASFSERFAASGVSGFEQGPLKGGPAAPFEGPLKGGPAVLTNEQELTKLKALVGVLGDAATITEQYTLKVREINKAKTDGLINDEEQKRAQAEANNQMLLSIQQTRERLGVATEANVAARQEIELSRDKSKAGLTEIEVDKARNIQLKERKELLEAQAVRAAQFPGLKREQLDFGNLNKQLDQFGTSTLSNLENSLVDVIGKTKSLADAFKAMVDAILKDLARLLIRQTITAPLAGVLQGIFGGVAPKAAVGGIVGYSSFPGQAVPAGAFAGAQHFAGGGSVGGVPIVAHRGEIVGWPNQLKHAFGNEVKISVINNAPGVDVDTRQRNEGGITAIDFVINTTNKAATDGRLDQGLGGRFGARPRTVRR